LHRRRVADGALPEVGGRGVARDELGQYKGDEGYSKAQEQERRETPREEPGERPGQQPELPSRPELSVSRLRR
jgi:hypothetical protein